MTKGSRTLVYMKIRDQIGSLAAEFFCVQKVLALMHSLIAD